MSQSVPSIVKGVRYVKWNVDGDDVYVESQYEVQGLLGSGAYGKVYSCKNSEDRTVAIKHCNNIFHSRTFAKRILREMRILRHIKHDNVRQQYVVCVAS
jgi:serine/threonine protein kinase